MRPEELFARLSMQVKTYCNKIYKARHKDNKQEVIYYAIFQ